MALTATHFPKYGFTFAILFGCPLSIEAEVIQRLSRMNPGANHPLVLPGIFAELERSRHVAVVEKMIDQLESRIFELDFAPDSTSLAVPRVGKEREQIHRDKREDFLDTSYLRNGLISWQNQLRKMAKYAENFEGDKLQDKELASNSPEDKELARILPRQERALSTELVSKHPKHIRQLRKTNRKVLDRLEHIIEEYDDKIRDCTMRLDGMAMATQWVSLPGYIRPKEVPLGRSMDSP